MTFQQDAVVCLDCVRCLGRTFDIAALHIRQTRPALPHNAQPGNSAAGHHGLHHGDSHVRPRQRQGPKGRRGHGTTTIDRAGREQAAGGPAEVQSSQTGEMDGPTEVEDRYLLRAEKADIRRWALLRRLDEAHPCFLRFRICYTGQRSHLQHDRMGTPPMADAN